MSGSDPTGFNWFSDLVSSDSSGYQGSAIFVGAAAIVGGLGLAALAQSGTISPEGFTGASGLGGGIGIAQAVADVNDPGANATYATPTGELGSGAGLYNEGAVAPPAQTDDRIAAIDCKNPEACEATVGSAGTWMPMGTGVVVGRAGAGLLLRAWRWLWPAKVLLNGVKVAVGPGVTSVGSLGAKNQVIFVRAVQMIQQEGGSSFVQHLSALARSVAEFVPKGQVWKLGELQGKPIFGAIRNGLGIVEQGGKTVVVHAPQGGPVTVLGNLLP